MRWVGRVACMGHDRNGYRFFFCEKKEMRTLGILQAQMGNNIKIDCEIAEWGEWTDVYLAI